MIADELPSEVLHGIFVEHVQQEQEFNENFLNCHVLVKREQGRVDKREFVCFQKKLCSIEMSG